MKKVLILGVDGMLGNCLYSYFQQEKNINVTGTTRKMSHKVGKYHYLNLSYLSDYKKELKDIFSHNFDYVINCLSVNQISKDLEDGINKVIFINSILPRYIDKISYQYYFKFIHISTNGVFNGLKGGYSVFDRPSPEGLYAISKFNGEFYSKKNLIIRTSIIGHVFQGSRNLLDWFLGLNQEYCVEGYSNVFWNGITTLTFAKILARLIIQDININGIIHIGGARINKYDLLLLLSKIYSRNIEVKKNSFIKEDKTLLPSIEQSFFEDLILPLENQLLDLKRFYKKL